MPSRVAAQTATPDAVPAADEGPAKVEQIIVTGSRIRGVAPVGSAIVSVTRDDIESSGAVSTAQMLMEVPQVFNLGVSESSRGQSGGSGNITYGSSVNLRGIGPYATLALINGHRVVSQGAAGTGVDPSIMPTLALERVEIVADGASAIYGSDAVAGVVNMIMRRNVDGAEAMVRSGSAENYHERQIGTLWGHTWSGGRFTAAFQNDLHSALNGQSRDFYRADLTARGGGDFRSTQCAPGNIVIGGVTYAIPAGGVTAATGTTLVPGTINKCDNLKYADLLPRQERNTGTFTFNQDLGNGIKLYADGFVTRRVYRLQPAMLVGNLTVPSTNPFYVRPPGAPAGASETVTYSFANDLPPDIASGYSKAAEATVGADVAVGAGWQAGALFTYGKDKDLNTTRHGLNNAAVNAALNSSNLATALNPFGAAPNNPATLVAISNAISLTPGDSTFQNLQVKADGPLYTLPAGEIRAAVGYEGQKIELEGGQTTGPADSPITGSIVLRRIVNSAYGELQVPIFGARNGRAGLRKLDLNIAARVDRYSDVGSTNNPKLGVNWSPVNGLTLRGSYGTSFRAPGLTQIRGTTNGGRGGLYVQNYSDPLIGGATRVGVALSASSPDLKPETATTRSIGFDWEPAIGNKTRLSLTYFDILYENQVTSYLSDLSVLNRESQLAGTNVIQRNPSPALVAQLLANYPLSRGVLPSVWTLFIDGSNKNLGKSISKGFDFQASTRFPTASLGTFGVSASGTVFTRYQLAITPDAPLEDQLNTIYNPLRLKARLSATWTIGALVANAHVNYQNAYINNLAKPAQEVASFTSVDARVAYEFSNGPAWSDGTTLALGVTNLFNRPPPFVNIAQSNLGGGGFDPTLASPVGRVVSVSMNKRF
jgi:iron complex outermembrane receptor protein